MNYRMLTIVVCVGSACHLKGAYSVINKLQELIGQQGLEDKVEVKAAFCLGQCSEAVSVKFEQEEEIYSLDLKNTGSFFEQEVLRRVG